MFLTGATRPVTVNPDASSLGTPKSSLRSGLAVTQDLFRAGRYAEAQQQTQELIAVALRAGDQRTATRATGNLGGLRFALHQYRGALAAFLEARRMSGAMGGA